jgi:hypothetical protein
VTSASSSLDLGVGRAKLLLSRCAAVNSLMAWPSALCVLCDLLFKPDRSQQIRSVSQHVLMMSFEQKIAKIAKEGISDLNELNHE